MQKLQIPSEGDNMLLSFRFFVVFCTGIKYGQYGKRKAKRTAMKRTMHTNNKRESVKGEYTLFFFLTQLSISTITCVSAKSKKYKQTPVWEKCLSSRYTARPAKCTQYKNREYSGTSATGTKQLCC